VVESKNLWWKLVPRSIRREPPGSGFETHEQCPVDFLLVGCIGICFELSNKTIHNSSCKQVDNPEMMVMCSISVRDFMVKCGTLEKEKSKRTLF
jgi:hypothetical protein